MAREIERKFLAAEVPADAAGAEVALRQGYLAVDGEVEVRLRADGQRFVMTVKGGRGMQRAEVEVDVEEADFDELWPFTAGRRIEKRRRRVDVDPGAVAEVDVYEGELAGLVVVEVEFPSTDDAAAFVPPSWFGPELTGQAGWSNAELAQHGRPDAT